MSEGRFIADTLEAILVGMADSLRDAQTVLDSAPPTDSYGRPSSRYAIPHLDFEMTFELEFELVNKKIRHARRCCHMLHRRSLSSTRQATCIETSSPETFCFARLPLRGS